MSWKIKCFILLSLINNYISAQEQESMSYKCPFNEISANEIDFTGAALACVPFGVQNVPIDEDICNGCICNLIQAISLELKQIGYPNYSLIHAEELLRSCAKIFVEPLKSHGLTIEALLRLGECTKLPICLQQDDDYDKKDEDHKEDVECDCNDEFDPMCDYDGKWYTNLCEATCKGAVVEKCYPIFKEIETPYYKFTLTEKDSPFIWLAGCTCPNEGYSWEPVCDINAKQYPSPCFAHCQGVYEYYNCEEIIIDFEYSGEGPKIQKFAGPPTEDEPIDTITIIDDLDNEKKKKKKKKEKPNKKEDEDEMIKNSMYELFKQSNIDMSHFPVYIQERVADAILNIPITKKQLDKSRDYLKDKELMSHISQTTSENHLSQFEEMAKVSEGNNEVFMQELVQSLSITDVDEDDQLSKPYEDMVSMNNCFKNCKTMKEVCSLDGKQEFPSSCHAKCMGVEKTKSCNNVNHDNSGTISRNILRISLIWIVTCIYISYHLIDFIF